MIISFCNIKYDLILGFAKGWSSAIWPTSSLKIFQLIANLGLIFFMFFLGLELDLNQIKANWKVTIPVACVSIIFPGMYNVISFICDKYCFDFSGYWMCSSFVVLSIE